MLFVKLDNHEFRGMSCCRPFPAEKITFLYVEFLDDGKSENIFQSYFLEIWRSQGISGAIDISYQTRGAEFPVIRVIEKPNFLHSGTCTSTSM